MSWLTHWSCLLTDVIISSFSSLRWNQKNPDHCITVWCSRVGMSFIGLDFSNCCFAKLADTKGWLLLLAFRRWTPNAPCVQQDSILLSAILRWWPLQQDCKSVKQIIPCVQTDSWKVRQKKAFKGIAQNNGGCIGQSWTEWFQIPGSKSTSSKTVL